jgi:hypothetical protein
LDQYRRILKASLLSVESALKDVSCEIVKTYLMNRKIKLERKIKTTDDYFNDNNTYVPVLPNG